MRWFFITVFVPSSIAVPLVIALWKYKYLPRAVRIIFYYLLLAGCINFVAVMLASRRINNLPLLHVYTAIEFMILSLFYKKILPGKKASRLLYLLLFLFPVICVLNAWLLQSIFSYNTYTRSLEAIVVIAYALFYYNEMADQAIKIDFVHEPVFWMNAGLLVYFSGSLLLFLFAAFITADRQMDIWAWRVHATLVLLMYILFTMGFLKCKK